VWKSLRVELKTSCRAPMLLLVFDEELFALK